MSESSESNVKFEKRIGIIGAGNMSYAIASGLVSCGAVQADKVTVSDVDGAKLAPFASLGIYTTADNQETVDRSDIIVTAVKPQVYEVALSPLTNTDGKLFVSIAPGLSIAYVKRLLGSGQTKVVRVMPNTPMLVGCGASALCYAAPVSEAEFASVCALFAHLGVTAVIPEDKMNEVVAVNGSSPAYVFMLIDAMMKTAQSYGFNNEIAKSLIAGTVLGAAKMVLESSDSPEQLKQNVCSKGGTTIEAVGVLERGGLYPLVQNAMDACTEKAKILAKD